MPHFFPISDCIIDFQEEHFAAGDAFLIQPGQVHRFAGSDNMEGWALAIDGCLVSSAEKYIFENFSLFASSFQVDRKRRSELKQIISLLAGRTNYTIKEFRISDPIHPKCLLDPLCT